MNEAAIRMKILNKQPEFMGKNVFQRVIELIEPMTKESLLLCYDILKSYVQTNNNTVENSGPLNVACKFYGNLNNNFKNSELYALILKCLSEMYTIAPEATWEARKIIGKDINLKYCFIQSATDEMRLAVLTYFTKEIKLHPEDAGKLFVSFFQEMLTFLLKQDSTTKREFLASLKQMTTRYVSRPFHRFTQIFVQLFCDNDALTAQYAIDTYNNIIKYLPKDFLLKPTVIELINTFSKVKSYNIKLITMNNLLELIKAPVPIFKSTVLESASLLTIAFKKLLKPKVINSDEKNDLFHTTNKDKETATDITSSFVKICQFIKEEYKNDANEFLKLQPVVDQIIISGQKITSMLGMIFSDLSNLSQSLRIGEIISRFTIDVIRGQNVDNITSILMKCNFSILLSGGSLISALKKKFLNNDITTISTDEFLAFLRKLGYSDLNPPNIPEVTDMKSLEALLDNKSINAYDIYDSKAVDQILTLIKSITEPDYNYLNKFERLRDICVEILSIIYPGTPYNPIESDTIEEIFSGRIKLKIVVGGESGHKFVYTGHYSDHFFAVEAWLNESLFGITRQDLFDAISTHSASLSSNMTSFITQDYVENATLSQLAVLHTLFQTQGYHSFSFSYNGRSYLARHSVLSAILESLPDPNTLYQIVPEITANPTSVVIDDPDHRIFECRSISKFLEILKEVHRLLPMMDMTAKDFADTMYGLLRDYPCGTITGVSFAPWIITMYPFLFPFKHRILAARMLWMGLPRAAAEYARVFENKYLNFDPFIFEIEDSDIKSIGLSIMNYCRRIQFDFKARMNGTPLSKQLFFVLYSKSVAHNLEFPAFRTREDLSNVFPAPNIEKQVMFLLGVICAKAISMRCVLGFRFNPAFFRLLLGQKISIEDVDQELAFKLNNEEWIGERFVYPGLEDFVLGPELDITTGNLPHFKRRVESTTCGEDFALIAERFKVGFSRVFPWTAMEVFSADEIVELLSGRLNAISREEAEEHIRFEGFSNSVAKNAFVDFLCSARGIEIQRAVYVATGAFGLPEGGIAALHPPLRVVRSDGAIINDASSHTIKIPAEVTSEEIKTEFSKLALL